MFSFNHTGNVLLDQASYDIPDPNGLSQSAVGQGHSALQGWLRDLQVLLFGTPSAQSAQLYTFVYTGENECHFYLPISIVYIRPVFSSKELGKNIKNFSGWL